MVSIIWKEHLNFVNMAGRYFADGGLPLNFALFSSISVLQPLDVSSSPAVTRKMSTVGVGCPCGVKSTPVGGALE